MNSENVDADFDPRIGLCSICVHARIIGHPRGGVPYTQCTLAETVRGFEKYPRTPVFECDGFTRKASVD